MKQFRSFLTLLAVSLFALSSLGTSAMAAKVKYNVVKKKSKIKIDIYHPAKHIKGHSKKLKGFATFDGAKGSFKLDGAFTLKIRKLRSGNKRRDRAMWRALGKSVQKYIYFYPKTLKVSGGKGTITGEFSIRQKTKKVTFAVSDFKGTVGKTALTFVAKGKIKCSDFNITRPSLLFVKIKDLVDVKVKITLKMAK